MTEDIRLSGQPVSERGLREAYRLLTGMEDLADEGQQPWITAARLAVRDALQREASEDE